MYGPSGFELCEVAVADIGLFCLMYGSGVVCDCDCILKVLFSLILFDLQEMGTSLIHGNDHLTGHVISTTIGGKNGQPKRVSCQENNLPFCPVFGFGLNFECVSLI